MSLSDSAGLLLNLFCLWLELNSRISFDVVEPGDDFLAVIYLCASAAAETYWSFYRPVQPHVSRVVHNVSDYSRRACVYNVSSSHRLPTVLLSCLGVWNITAILL